MLPDIRPNALFRPAAFLFGSVLAMTLAGALAALLAYATETGDWAITFPALESAWHGSPPIQSIASLLTAFLITVGLGWLTAESAFSLSQLFCILVLIILCARVGWVISRDGWHMVVEAASAGVLGFALAAIKYVTQ